MPPWPMKRTIRKRLASTSPSATWTPAGGGAATPDCRGVAGGDAAGETGRGPAGGGWPGPRRSVTCETSSAADRGASGAGVQMTVPAAAASPTWPALPVPASPSAPAPGGVARAVPAADPGRGAAGGALGSRRSANGGLPAAFRGRAQVDAEDRHRLRLAFERYGIEDVDGRRARQPAIEQLGDQDLPAAGPRAEARGGGDRGADDRVLQPLGAADVAGEDFAGIEADADGDRPPALTAPLGVEPGDPALHGDRRLDCPVGVIAASQGRPPERHHRVADELVERPAVLEDHGDHLGEVLGEQAGDLVRAHLLGERGEAADVGEQDDDFALGAAELHLALGAGDLTGEIRGEVTLEGRQDQ